MANVLDFPSLSCISEQSVQLRHEESSSAVGSDSAARAQSLDTRSSFVVEAPAGSGKTGLLVQRFLNLLGSFETSAPEEILAITFTRKATAELRERIFLQLEAAAADAPLPNPASAFERQTRELARAALDRDRQHGWNLLSSPRRLRVQTIDSLCMEIAGTLPLLSGTAARRPVDDASELYRQAARNTLRQLGGTDRQLHRALYDVLLHRDANLGDVERLLAEMLATREQWAELVPLDRASLTDEYLDQHVRMRLERTLEHIVCAGLNRALRAMPASALGELAAFAHEFSGELGYNGYPSPIRLCSDHPAPPAAEAEHLDHWRALINLVLTGSCEWRAGFNVNQIGFPLSKADKARLKNLIQNIQCEPLREALQMVRCLPPSKYPDDQWHQAKALLRLLLHALAELRLLFSETGECDFTEFSLAARHALASHTDGFYTTSGAALRHLLVDEMQDTSSAQYDLLTALTRTWDGQSQTVFLVGDPKQSIYLFRQARVERFLRITQDGRLGDIPLRPLQLTANFRSRPALVGGVNRDALHLFAPPGESLSADTVDVPFVTATPTRSDAPGAGVHWHTRILQTGAPWTRSAGSFDRAEQGSVPTLALAASAQASEAPGPLDAAAIRQIVERWRATPLPPERQATMRRAAQPWRIAVLAAARTHFAPIIAEFNDPVSGARIPYRAVDIVPLEDRPEILDILALTRALHHPGDRAAWFAVLRAPWCGLTAPDLLTLAAEGDSIHTKSTVPQLVAARSSLLSSEGKSRMQQVWPILNVSLEEASRSIAHLVIVRAWLSLGGDASLSVEERSNVGRFFELLRKAQTGSSLDMVHLKRSLKELYAEPASSPEAVELMTIHSAKGLEWDVVIVPELGRQGRRETSRLLNWLEIESGSEPAVLLAPIQRKGEPSGSLYQWLNHIYSRRLQAERKRVFYVACTRAREELHLFATAKQGKTGLEAAPGSLLHACWPAAEPHFAQSAAETMVPGVPAPLQLVTPSAAAGKGYPAGLRAEGPGLALAASADSLLEPTADTRNRFAPRLTRMPLSFDPGQRFREAAARRLPYTPAAQLPQQRPLSRPEGSAAVRALGNVVHRFLELIARRLTAVPGTSVTRLEAELPTWIPRLTASLRSEGLAPAEAYREATRALTLLANTLADPVGVWLLSPHPKAASEQPLATMEAGLLRVDRTFHAGDSPLSAPADAAPGTVWVVDFKTAEPGGRSPEAFATEQRETYGAQLARYAAALRAAAPGEGLDIQLGLYFPAIPRLVHWRDAASESWT